MTDPSAPPSDAPPPEGEEEERTRSRWLDSVVPLLVRKVIAQGTDALNKEELKDTVVAELFRKAVKKGGEAASSTEESVRKMLSDLPLPNEVIERVVERFDDYKADAMRVVKEEFRAFLDRIDIGYELQKMLTSLSFEITTEIRFIPNEKGIRPDVKAGARVKRTRREKPESEEPT
jgi:hypothetical protein